ncbi:hypothetical protein FFF34_010115 [Inquilinus sp. KBS0705]|nr:hypothetical protein FFF34_010115 [Inquilinus sp. KBS0705]
MAAKFTIQYKSNNGLRQLSVREKISSFGYYYLYLNNKWIATLRKDSSTATYEQLSYRAPICPNEVVAIGRQIDSCKSTSKADQLLHA